MAKGTLESLSQEMAALGPAQGESCESQEEGGTGMGFRNFAEPIFDTKTHDIPGKICCFRFFINAKSVCDGCGGSSSQDVSTAALRSSNKAPLPAGPG